VDRSRTGSIELQKARERIERLQVANERLTKQNADMIEMFVRWAYNASLAGMDEQRLNQPLPPSGRS
jgi:hypothetical protein